MGHFLGTNNNTKDIVTEYFRNSKPSSNYSFQNFCKYQLHIDKIEDWQLEIIEHIDNAVIENNFNGTDPAPPIKIAIASGHGVGKTALFCWVVLWLLYRRSNVVGVITANTFKQLRDKTWREMYKWLKVSELNWYFLHNKIQMINLANSSICNGISSNKNNFESFAGQHNRTSSSFFCFDEGSAIPEKIYETAEGGMTDGEPFFIVCGNPTRCTGYFYDIFNNRPDWVKFRVSSYDSTITNKNLLEDWKNLYGENSDFYRIRVLGEFPKEDSSNLVPNTIINKLHTNKPQSSKRNYATLGIDVAREGSDKTVICSITNNVIKFIGALDSKNLIHTYKFILGINKIYDYDYIFVDDIGVGGGLTDILKTNSKLNVKAVTVSKSAKKKEVFSNLRAELAYISSKFLKTSKLIKNKSSTLFIEDLKYITYGFDSSGRIKLSPKDEIKANLKRSPDYFDAFMLNFFVQRKENFENVEIDFDSPFDFY